MEDSIELSSEHNDSLHDINQIVSPKNRKLTKLKNITASQESLAYSNSTLTKGNRTQRTNRDIQRQKSPPSIFSEFKNLSNNLNISSNVMKKQFDKKYSTGILMLEERSKSNQIQQRNIFVKDTEIEDLQVPNFTSEQNSPIKKNCEFKLNQNSTSQIRARIKTQNQAENRKKLQQIRHKNKELQYALQVQIINSQQLRTKVQILNQLLSVNLKKNGMNLLLFKNTSKNLSHIDLYVELQKSQKSRKQFQIQNERLLQDLQQTKKELQKYKQKDKKQIKTQTSYISNMNQHMNQHQSFLILSDLRQENSRLQQEKQSLFNFIQEQTKLVQQKDEKLKIIQAQIQLARQKEQRFYSIQRPKILKQIEQISKKNSILVEQMQKKKMQQSLTQLKYKQIINSLKEIHVRQIQQKELLIQRLKTQSQRYATENQSQSHQKHLNNYEIIQYSNDKNNKLQRIFESQVQTIQTYLGKEEIMVELNLLKKQRDHFMRQLNKNLQLNKEIFGLKIELKQTKANLCQYQKIFQKSFKDKTKKQ